MNALTFAPSIPAPSDRSEFQGYVDTISSDMVAGWCVEVCSPTTASQIDILIEDIALAEGSCSTLRADVPYGEDSGEGGCGFNLAGFHIPVLLHRRIDAVARLLARYDGRLTQVVELRAVGYAKDPMPSLMDDPHTLEPATPNLLRRPLAEWMLLWNLELDQAMLQRREPIYAALREAAGETGPLPSNQAELYKSALRVIPANIAVPAMPDQETKITGYIDRSYYCGQKPNIPLNTDVLAHYLREGRKGKRELHPLFDADFYAKDFKAKLGAQPDMENVFFHFLRYGARLNVDPHPCFSMWWYRSKYNLDNDVHPWVDYVTGGWMFGREPNWVFDTSFVESQLADPAVLSGCNPLQAYLTDPARNNFAAHPLFAIRRTHSASKANEGEGERYCRYLAGARAGAKFSNGLFDHDHYMAQGDIQDAPDALAHYMLVGEAENRSPNYLFDPAWYRRTYQHSSAAIGPLHDYIASGSKRLRDPSPLFSTRYYVETNSDVTQNGISPLLHFLITGDREGRRPDPLFNPDWFRETGGTGVNPYKSFIAGRTMTNTSPHPALVVRDRAHVAAIPAFLAPAGGEPPKRPFGIDLLFTHGVDGNPIDPDDAAREIRAFERDAVRIDSDSIRRLKMDEPIIRMSEIIDQRRVDRFAAQGMDRRYTGDVAPLVSVILPTRNRHHVLKRAIDSVLAQTHVAIELIVIDDGSTDGSDGLVGALADPRIVLLRQPHRGVCAARNLGLEAARGTYLAYLDSDNHWEPNYLEVMLKTLQEAGRDVGHAILRVYHQQSGAIRYRGDVYDEGSLDRENYIDMNIFVHHRRFVDEGFRFDESLRRCVDWDIIRRICLQEPSLFIPVIGCNYVDDAGELGRITTTESPGDFYKLMTRQIDLAPHVRGIAADSPRFTIIWPISGSDEADCRVALWHALQHLRSGFHELIIVNNNLSANATTLLDSLCGRISGLRVIHFWRDMLQFPAANLASRIADSDRLLFWSGHARYDADMIERLMADLDAVDAVIHPVVVDDSRRPVDGLFTSSVDQFGYQPLLAAQSIDPRVSQLIGAGSESFPVAVRRERFEQLGTFDTEYCVKFGLVAFGLTALADRDDALIVRFDRTFDAVRPAIRHGSDDNRRTEATRLAKTKRETIPVKLRVVEEDLIVAPLQRRYGVNLERLAPLPAAVTFLPRIGAGCTLRFQIMCPAPSGPELGSWGDYHYAVSLRTALEELGHDCRIRLADQWNHPSPGVDVVLHIRGIADIRPVPGALNLLWIISHPDKVRASELEAVSGVFATSALLAEQLRRRFGVIAHVMPQATDAKRFAFQDQLAVPRLASKYLFLGNSRKVPRAIVMDAVQLGLPLEVHGREWEFYLSAGQVAGRFVPNEQVARLYRSALCTLNDHWPTMAAAGIISNRLFDVVAAGGVAISDRVSGIDTVFGDHVRTYRTVDDLRDLTNGIADLLPSLRQRREASRRIIAEHSFAVRARQIINVVGQL